ncbi:hypothetical protein GMDG_04681 [Pseudogymnoascus destructans 20631-21]|uniref:Uncharacterized protein n=1 Tax=Pseudogymnoascus destructans (strain ATCC MYA-4855 / 20631-21) TaxID=658429 RepID=L8GB41_PSED2|nr:hypothetical protein GMDG_04681 [Pseudogymnoascus destructans 20631-21]
MLALTKMHLPKGTMMEPDWVPSYNPWEQRLCTSPDADFFLGLKTGKSDVVLMPSPSRTGGPCTPISSSQPPVSASASPERSPWMMVQDLPNMAFPSGYLHSSWTLGTDATAVMACRLIKHMQAQNISAPVPRLSLGGKEDMEDNSCQMSSTYMRHGKSAVPEGGGVCMRA